VPEGEEDAAWDRALDLVEGYLGVVLRRPATTLAGLRAKALAVEDEVQHFRPDALDADAEGDRTDALLGSLLLDVLALTAIGEGNAAS
jgi:hypothetical protein